MQHTFHSRGALLAELDQLTTKQLKNKQGERANNVNKSEISQMILYIVGWCYLVFRVYFD